MKELEYTVCDYKKIADHLECGEGLFKAPNGNLVLFKNSDTKVERIPFYDDNGSFTVPIRDEMTIRTRDFKVYAIPKY